jgi:hypothetical protein
MYELWKPSLKWNNSTILYTDIVLYLCTVGLIAVWGITIVNKFKKDKLGKLMSTILFAIAMINFIINFTYMIYNTWAWIKD